MDNILDRGIYYTKMLGDRLRPEIMHGDVLAGRQVSAPVFGDLNIIQACGYGDDIVGYVLPDPANPKRIIVNAAPGMPGTPVPLSRIVALFRVSGCVRMY
ncbi:hypothetical protein [Chitinophaga cymbidii]|uniref:Uncharacterized protein n=1 Tax=Chitinophaga cymbidii TaxID=1096750 RepID=A0A512RIM0_9BACT|nr:hypothetical protein [Chitinophaga cymbidii]GEP95546.1 hypothetical protein CCY01nite_18060 [Chitinophaga cymbidii]